MVYFTTTLAFAFGLILPLGSGIVNAQCEGNLLVDDFSNYEEHLNALDGWTSDDQTMESISVVDNKLTFVPKADAYFYTTFECRDLPAEGYNALEFDFKGPANGSYILELQTSAEGCNSSEYQSSYLDISGELTGTFTVPLTSFEDEGANINAVRAIVWQDFVGSGEWELSSIEFVCTGIEPREPPEVVLTIENFQNPDVNALGFWHGGDDGLSQQYSGGRLTLQTSSADLSWYTTLTETCRDFSQYDNTYLHLEWSGSNEFTIALQQHNAQCDSSIAPFPETWDVVDARRYAVGNNIYVPMSHFNINKGRTIAFSLKGFYSQTGTPTTLSKFELISSLPDGVSVPPKARTAPMYFQCTRPNSFAFAIDDGVPGFAQQVMQIIKDEGIKVTFFTVGQALDDPSLNFTNVYREMSSLGHQIGLHSYTHPPMEGLPTEGHIDGEITRNMNALKSQLGLESNYFRPPYGTEGARLRTRLAALIPDARVIQWSVDIEDWLWGENSPTPEKQLEAFDRDVAKGGNLVVLHYLYPSTVSYLREFIRRAKATGKQIMRVDQCMEDPNAPPL